MCIYVPKSPQQPSLSLKITTIISVSQWWTHCCHTKTSHILILWCQFWWDSSTKLECIILRLKNPAVWMILRSLRVVLQVVKYLLKKLELIYHRNLTTDGYSCGTRRKLSTAIALIGHPQILLLVSLSRIWPPRCVPGKWHLKDLINCGVLFRFLNRKNMISTRLIYLLLGPHLYCPHALESIFVR